MTIESTRTTMPVSSSPPSPSSEDIQMMSRDPEDVILLTVIRCIGLLYGYYQVRLLCNLGSKYTLAITSIFPLFGSLLFTSSSFLLPDEFKEIPETLLYFLLIMDLPRACFLTSIALQNTECCKVGACSSNIVQGVKILAPWLTMDTVIECIVLLLGYCSGIRRLEALCTFVCLSVLINYTVLLTVFPLALRILHEVIGSNKESDVGNSLSSSSPCFVDLDNNNGPSSCSKLDHILQNCNWGEASSSHSSTARHKSAYERMSIQAYANEPWVCQLIQPSSFWLRGKILAAVILALAYVFGWISVSVDQLVVLSVAAALTIRYLFFEEKSDTFRTVSEESTVTTTTTTVDTIYVNSSSGSPGSASDPSATATTETVALLDSSSSRHTSALPTVGSNRNNNSLSICAPIKPFKSGEIPSTRRVRKMPVTSNEVEIILQQNEKNNLLESGRTGAGKDMIRELCASPDSGICGKSSSTCASGSVTPITFSIGDHSESDDEGEDTTSTSGLRMKMKRSETKSDLENKLENLKLERERDGERWNGPPRSIEECLALYHSDEGVKQLSDEEVINLVKAKHIPAYQLEKAVLDLERGVAIRRKLSCMQKDVTGPTPDIPYKNYDYTLVQGACCENVIGYIPIPVGIAGPLKMDDKMYYIPMATTEGCLVASTNRGCRAFLQNGVRARVVNDGMSRAPVVRFPDAVRAAEAMIWLGEPENFEEIKQSFDASSRFARLVKIHPRIAGRYLFIRFVAKTGDAMGMNMISKGTEVALLAMQNVFHDMEVLALSGNVCTDKKPAAINWLEGRGKSVVSEAVIPAHVVETVLKTTTAALVELNVAKNLIGSAAAGSIGGFNAHAANIVTAIYIACGQDPAQNIASSNCMTIMEPCGADGRDLFISCTMPSIECGTIGGGTILPPQAACLEMLGVRGANRSNPGENARTFARIVSAAVLAGELSLMSALAAGHLVRSHLKHNRSATLLSALESGNPSSTPLSRAESQRDVSCSSGGVTSDDSSSPLAPASPIQMNSTPSSPSTVLMSQEIMKNQLNCKSPSTSPVITTMDFLSVPDCKQT